MRYDAWQRVLQLVSSEQVVAARSNIDAVAVNEAIGRCKRGGHWQMALALLRNMKDWIGTVRSVLKNDTRMAFRTLGDSYDSYGHEMQLKYMKCLRPGFPLWPRSTVP